MIAVAPDPIGVDIEAFPRSDTVAQVSHLLHSAERTEIRHAPAREQAKVFARIWTRKEAYLKAVGVGLAHQFATDYLASAVSLTGPPDWFVFNVPAPSGFAAATAIRRGDGQVDRTGPGLRSQSTAAGGAEGATRPRSCIGADLPAYIDRTTVAPETCLARASSAGGRLVG